METPSARPASRGRCHCAENAVSPDGPAGTPAAAHTAASGSRPRRATATSVSGLLKTNCFQGKRLPLTGPRRVTRTDASAAADTRLALCGPGSRGTRRAAGSLGLCAGQTEGDVQAPRGRASFPGEGASQPCSPHSRLNHREGRRRGRPHAQLLPPPPREGARGRRSRLPGPSARRVTFPKGQDGSLAQDAWVRPALAPAP